MANPRTIARLEGLIKRRAAHCLQFELNDPRAGFVTILRAELSSDLSSAKIHYSVLGDANDRSRVQHMLEHAGGFIQHQVGRVLHLRRIPHMRWIYDDSIAEAARMDELIRDARARDRAINPSLAETDPAVEPAGEEERLWSEHEEDEEPDA
jgi:ribosome-binding factor A